MSRTQKLQQMLGEERKFM